MSAKTGVSEPNREAAEHVGRTVLGSEEYDDNDRRHDEGAQAVHPGERKSF